MKLYTIEQLKNFNKEEMKKFNHSYHSAIYTEKNKEYYKKYQKDKYKKDRAKRLRYAKKKYWKEVHNKDIYFINTKHII